MIKVLKKAFGILEIIAANPSQPINLGCIAGQLDLNQPTAARILKTLVDSGYVEQVAPKKGYILGPMSYSLARFGPYRKDLVLTAEPEMAKLAEKIQETVIITAIHKAKRYTLHMITGNRQIQVSNEVVYDDHIYQTATGRLLMAYLTELELDNLIKKTGLPGRVWPEADSLEKLQNELEKIRQQKQLIIDHKEVVGIALPIYEAEKAAAALGVFLPGLRFTGQHREQILDEMQATAEKISLKLT